VATVVTTCGDFEITLDAKRAPRPVGSFKYLADKGFFDGLTFHRIVSGFVIQGGDPSGDGSGGPGYSMVEAPPRPHLRPRASWRWPDRHGEAGHLGSQFFVVTAEDAQLPPEYALLGKVSKGQEVVDAIGVLPTTGDEQPAEPLSSARSTSSRAAARAGSRDRPLELEHRRLRTAPPP
jgi:cyclophilin family peptidyl-prolyl cis-trans isomerase